MTGKLDRYKDLTDSELIERLQRGEMRSFETLVNRYKKRAFYLALGLVGDADEAHDISQEAFIRVYRSVKRFDTSKEFFSWFYVIVSNLARNQLKKRAVRTAHARDLQADSSSIKYSQTRSNPEVLMQADETKHQIWKGIEKLPFNFREIIILRHFEDLSYDEIARLLKIPKGSVMSRLYYARLKLKQIIEAEDE